MNHLKENDFIFSENNTFVDETHCQGFQLPAIELKGLLVTLIPLKGVRKVKMCLTGFYLKVHNIPFRGILEKSIILKKLHLQNAINKFYQYHQIASFAESINMLIQIMQPVLKV